MNKPTQSELLQAADALNSQPESVEFKDKLAEMTIPLLKNNHDIQSQFGTWKPTKSGIWFFANLIQTKLANIVVAVTQPAIRKQQKFNQLALEAIIELKRENDQLKQQLKASGN
jgi:hypothetical protein